MTSLERVRGILAAALQLGQNAETLTPDTALLGSIPELDSVTVVSLINALEEQFGIEVADDEIDASVFATVQTLTTFVDGKLGSD